MALPQGERSLDIKARLNGKMREMVRAASGLGEAEMKWTRPESMVQSYGVKVVGWPSGEETGTVSASASATGTGTDTGMGMALGLGDEQAEEPVPMRNPSNNSALQNKRLLNLIEAGVLRIERVTEEDRKAFALGSTHTEDHGVDLEGAELGAAEDGTEGGKKKRGKGRPPGKKRKIEREDQERERERERERELIGFVTPDQEGEEVRPEEEDLGVPDLGVTTLQEGMDVQGSRVGSPVGLHHLQHQHQHLPSHEHSHSHAHAHSVPSGSGGRTDYPLILPRDSPSLLDVDELHSPATSASGTHPHAHSQRSTTIPPSRRRAALNPDKEGLPRPRNKSMLMLNPDGSIVPTSQRQLLAEAKRKNGPSVRIDPRKRRRVELDDGMDEPVEDGLGLTDVPDSDEAVIRALREASTNAHTHTHTHTHTPVVTGGEHAHAEDMFLRDNDDTADETGVMEQDVNVQVGDQDSAMVLAMMGGSGIDSAQMMRFMQQQAASSSASSINGNSQMQQQQQTAMGTYGPPPGTSHGQHGQIMSHATHPRQRLSQDGHVDGDDQIMELYQVTGPDFGQSAGSGTVGSSRPDESDGQPDPTRSQAPFDMEGHPYMLAIRAMASDEQTAWRGRSETDAFVGTDDLGVGSGREGENEIDLEGEMNAIGQFAEHIGGERQGESGDL